MKKPQRKPKPLVVWMWTEYDKETRGLHYGTSTVKRNAERFRTDSLQRGCAVGPITRVELPRPVKQSR